MESYRTHATLFGNLFFHPSFPCPAVHTTRLAGWFLLVSLIPSSVYTLVRRKSNSCHWKWRALESRDGKEIQVGGVFQDRSWPRLQAQPVHQSLPWAQSEDHMCVTSNSQEGVRLTPCCHRCAFIMFASKYLLGISGWATHSTACFIGKGRKETWTLSHCLQWNDDQKN